MNIINYAPAIKETVSGGTAICKNVSPLKHNLDVKVKSKNLFDYTNLDTKYSGLAEAILEENVLKVEHNLSYTTGYTSANYAIPHIKDLAGKTITISAQAKTGTDAGQAMIRILFVKPTSIAIGGYTDIYCSTKSTEFTTITATGVIKTDMPEEDCELCVLFYSNAGGNASASGVSYYKDVQIEIGSTATPYTPYRTEFEGVEVSRYGKNLISTDNIEVSGTGAWTSKILTKQPLPDGTYTFSCEYENLTENITTIGIVVRDIDEKWISETYGNNGTIKLTFSTTNGISIYLYSNMGSPSTFTDIIFKNIQLELGSTVTEYEPYKEPQTATANADGVVEGLTSLSPNMTLLPGTEDVAIDCVYNKSTKAYIDEKVSALSVALLEV